MLNMKAAPEVGTAAVDPAECPPSSSSASAPATSRLRSNRRQLWATRLEEVLGDFEALQRFQAWLGVDDDSSEHPLRLHFAIRAFRQMHARRDPRALQLAREMFNKFLRLRTGLCAFIDEPIRERIGQRLKATGNASGNAQSGLPEEDLFDECVAPLDAFLRKQHALFVQSHDFLELYNNDSPSVAHHHPDADPSASCSVDNAVAPLAQWPTVPSAQRRSRRRDSSDGVAAAQPAQLTANTLMRSQRDRQALVPAGGAGELFKPVSRFPYVGQPQCSKKDSAVSSSFSSDHHLQPVAGAVGNNSLRHLRDGQRRANAGAPLLNTFPRNAAAEHCAPPAGGAWSHDTQQGRREFAERLAQKLRQVETQLHREECVNRQIDRINAARQRGGAGTSTRELIIAGAGAEEGEADTPEHDADDDVENYLRRRMATMDSSSAGSAPQTPPLLQPRVRTRRKSRASCSPHAQTHSLGAYPQQHMSQSCYQPVPQIGYRAGGAMAPTLAQPQQPFAAAQLGGPSAPFLGPSGPPSGTSAAFFNPSVALSQSVHLSPMPPAGPSSKPPPFFGGPMKPHLMSAGGYGGAGGYCDNDGDTSGIGSMTTTHSGNSAGGTDKQRAAMFRRARELSSGGGHRNAQQAAVQPIVGTPRAGNRRNQSAQLPQPPPPPPFVAAAQHHPPLWADQQQAETVISFREPNGADGGEWGGRPVVAHVATHKAHQLSFRDFRRLLSISSRDRRQFFFKAPCEDGTAPYEWLLVADDSAIVPVFEGKVNAECRSRLSDSD